MPFFLNPTKSLPLCPNNKLQKPSDKRLLWLPVRPCIMFIVPRVKIGTSSNCTHAGLKTIFPAAAANIFWLASFRRSNSGFAFCGCCCCAPMFSTSVGAIFPPVCGIVVKSVTFALITIVFINRRPGLLNSDGGFFCEKKLIPRAHWHGGKAAFSLCCGNGAKVTHCNHTTQAIFINILWKTKFTRSTPRFCTLFEKYFAIYCKLCLEGMQARNTCTPYPVKPCKCR